MNGAVVIESTPGTGTIVKTLLPAIEPFQKKIALSAGSEKNTSKLSGDILLADDDDSILDIGRAMLERLGFTVHTAEDGQKAVEMLRRQDIHFSPLKKRLLIIIIIIFYHWRSSPAC